MHNEDLNRSLKALQVPELPAEYWEDFPRRVMARMQRAGAPKPGSSEALADRWPAGLFACRNSFRFVRRPVFASGLVAACVLLAIAMSLWRGRQPATVDPQFVEAQKCLGEIEALFPNQLRALVFDQQGPRLVLADKADVPSSPPVYLRISEPKGSHRFVTFSGQQIQVNGDVFDVLVDRQGGVLLMGEQSVWSSSAAAEKEGRYRIEARLLPTSS
jgi:hypothetical protein